MSGSIACPYKILGVSNLAENDEIELAFEVYKQAYELLIDGKKRRAYDRQAANEKEKVLQLKIEQLEKELQKKSKNGDEELKKLRKELGEKGGAGHYWGNDRKICQVGLRNEMEENELKKVLQLLAAGEKKINLKEREFRAFLSEKKNGEKLKKSLGGATIGMSPRLDGRSTSSLLMKKKEEMENISISGSNKKPDAPNSRRLHSKFVP